METEAFKLGDSLLALQGKSGLDAGEREPRNIPDPMGTRGAGDIEGEITPETMPDEWPEPSGVTTIDIKSFLEKDFPPRENILSPWLPSQGVAMIHAYRGIGKTHISLNIATAVASGGDFLRWRAEKPRGVLFIDGEMPARVLQERLAAIVSVADKEATAPFKIITPDLQQGQGMPNLAEKEGQEALEPHLEGVDLIIIDNLSTLCRGGRENEAESWLPAQEWALKLRSRGFSVLFIHHSGKNGNQRGTSRREDILDTVISLKHPGDYRPDEGARFEIHFEKARGIYGPDVMPVEAQLMTTPDGRRDWTVKDLEDTLTHKVANLLNEGVKQSEIPELLNIAKGTVSKHKKKADIQGLLDKKGKEMKPFYDGLQD